jgi:phi LC3 family holin
MMLFGIDFKARLRNKVFWASMAGAIVLLAQQLGLNIFPSNYTEIVNSALTLLTAVGILVNPTTPGICDQTSADTTDTASKSSDSTETK